jgi:flagellar motor switch protein FliG
VSVDPGIGIENLTGRQKAAILMVALGRTAASEVMRQMTPREVEEVTLEVAELGTVPNVLMEEVLAQFWENTLGRRKVERGGVDYARQVLTQTFGPDEGERILGKVVESIESRSFRMLKHLDSGQLISFLADEHPQTVALILVHLVPRRAAVVMAGLPEHLQGEVALRMARLGSIAPDAIKTIEAQLEKHVSAISLSSYATGGPAAVVDVLHQMDRASEEHILESLAGHDPDLADDVRNMMFVFEDIAKLDGRDIREMLKELDTRDLALALKGASEELAQKIFDNVSRRAQDVIREDMKYMGPVPLADVEAAQKTILLVLRRLEEEGNVKLTGREDKLVG